MNNSTRVAKVTFDVVFLLLLLLPILSYLLVCASDGGASALGASLEFDTFVSENFMLTENPKVSQTLVQVMTYFGFTPVVPYLTYVIYVSIAWVFVNCLCFIPKLCNKLLKGWI